MTARRVEWWRQFWAAMAGRWPAPRPIDTTPDDGDVIPLPALRALAAGEPLDEVAADYGVDRAVVDAAAPLVGRTP